MAKEHINNNIRTFRFMKNEMTQQDLANEIGVTRQTIVAIEKGKYPPTLEIAFRIAHIFEASITDVFSYDPSKDKIKRKKKSC